MFPEFRELLSQLKTSYPRLQFLFEKHNQLDHEIFQLEGPTDNGYCDEVVRLKKEKLRLKDEMHHILKAEYQKNSHNPDRDKF